MHDTILNTGITVGTVLGLLGGGLGVSIVVQLIKRLAGLNSSKVIHFVVVATSFAGVALTNLIGALHNSPSLLGAHTLEVLGLANAAHTFLVNDADQFVGKVKTALANQSVTPTVNAPIDAAPPVLPPPAPSDPIQPTQASF